MNFSPIPAAEDGIGFAGFAGMGGIIGVVEAFGICIGSEAAGALAIDAFEFSAISSLVKYRKPPTPIAARHTTSTTAGHSQFGAPVVGGAGFFGGSGGA